MIELKNVTKSYPMKHGMREVLSDINLTINPSENVGILGKNGAGKSTLVRLISGAERPSSGRIVRNMKVSWPLAFGGAFQSSLSGVDNVKFLTRIYNIPFKPALAFVDDFTELGQYLKEPIRNYSTGMRAKLAFAISMAIEFDCYLIDEVISVGDAQFQAKCLSELFEKRKDRALIIVSHSREVIKAYCDKAHVLTNGSLNSFDSIDDAYQFYGENEI